MGRIGLMRVHRHLQLHSVLKGQEDLKGSKLKVESDHEGETHLYLPGISWPLSASAKGSLAVFTWDEGKDQVWQGIYLAWVHLWVAKAQLHRKGCRAAGLWRNRCASATHSPENCNNFTLLFFWASLLTSLSPFAHLENDSDTMCDPASHPDTGYNVMMNRSPDPAPGSLHEAP